MNGNRREKFSRKFASSIKTNDIIKYNGDVFDVSDVKQIDDKIKIRMLSFSNGVIIDKQYEKDFVFDVMMANIKGIF